MRDISQNLKNAGMFPVAEPKGKLEIVSHPFMLSGPLKFTQFATMADPGGGDVAVDAVKLDNGTIIVVSTGDGGYLRITDPENVSQWQASWTAWSPSLPANSEVIAISANSTTVRAFARTTVPTYTAYHSDSTNGGVSWGAWTSMGTIWGSNENLAACSPSPEVLFLRHYNETNLLVLEAFDYIVSAWGNYNLYTGMKCLYPSASYVGAIANGKEAYYVYFSAVPETTTSFIEGVHVSEYTHGAFGGIEPAIIDQAAERLRFDRLKSVSGLGDRHVLVDHTFRTALMAPKPLYSYGDEFSSYENNYWKPLLEMEPDEVWVPRSGGTITFDSTKNVEGETALKHQAFMYASESEVWPGTSRVLDLSAEGVFTDDDYVCWYQWYEMDPDVSAQFFFNSARTAAFEEYYSCGDGPAFIARRKDQYTQVGGIGWDDVAHIDFYGLCAHTTPWYAIFDYMTLIKADPDDSAKPNPTGRTWNFQPDPPAWNITTDAQNVHSGYHLACLDKEAGVEKIAWLDYTTQSTIYTMDGWAFARDDGVIGLWFDGSDMTSGSEDGYAFVIDTSADYAYFYKYTAGTPTTITSQAFTCEPNVIYQFRVTRKGRNFELRVGPWVSGIDWSTSGTTITLNARNEDYEYGYQGVISIGCSSRFSAWQTKHFKSSETELDENAIHYVTNDGFLSQCILFDSYPPPDFLVGRYGFYHDDGGRVIYRADRAIDEVDLTITDDVMNFDLSYPYEASASLRATLYNKDARYTNHPLLLRGNGIRTSLGYKVPGETVEYANMGLFRINRKDEGYAPEGVDLSLDTLDANWLLKSWKASSVHKFESQNRLKLTFDHDQSDFGFMVNVGPDADWVWNEGGFITDYGQGGGDKTALTGENHGGVIVEGEFNFQTPAPDLDAAKVGLVLAADDDFQNGYLVLVSFYLTQRHLGVYRVQNGIIPHEPITYWSPSILNNTNFWLKVRKVGNKLYVYYRTNPGQAWSYQGVYVDTTGNAYLYGHVGVFGRRWEGWEVRCGAFSFASTDFKDRTVDEGIRFVAARSGVLDVVSQYEFEEDFNGSSLDPARWQLGLNSIDNLSVSGGVLQVSENAATVGYQFSHYKARDFIIDFWAKTTAPGLLVIIYRSNANLNPTGFLITITPGPMETQSINLAKMENGLANYYDYSKSTASIPGGVFLPYRLSVQGGQHNLWQGNNLLLSHFSYEYADYSGYFALGAYGTTPAYYDRIEVVKANGLVDFLTINPGDTGEQLVRGLTQYSGLNYYVEEDAVLKVGTFAPAAGQADVFGNTDVLTFEDQLFEASALQDDQDWVTHLRVIGKDGISLDYFDKSDGGLDALGYRFDILQADWLNSIDQLEAAAMLEITKRNSSVVQRALVGQVQVASQRGDRIRIKINKIPGYPEYGYQINDEFVIKSIQNLSLKMNPAPDMSMSIEVEDG